MWLVCLTQSISISLLWQPFPSGEGSWQWMGWPSRACLSFFTSIHCKSYDGLDTNFQEDSPFKSSAHKINSVLFFYKIASHSMYLSTERELTVILLPLQRPESPPHNFGRTSMTLRNPPRLRDGARWPADRLPTILGRLRLTFAPSWVTSVSTQRAHQTSWSGSTWPPQLKQLPSLLLPGLWPQDLGLLIPCEHSTSGNTIQGWDHLLVQPPHSDCSPQLGLQTPWTNLCLINSSSPAPVDAS